MLGGAGFGFKRTRRGKHKQLSGEACGRGRDFKWFLISAECSHKQLVEEIIRQRGVSNRGSMRKKVKCLPAKAERISSFSPHANATARGRDEILASYGTSLEMQRQEC